MVDDGIDIELNWKSLRKKLEDRIEKNSLEENVVEQEREIQSDRLREFLSSVEIKSSAPVLEKIKQVNETFGMNFNENTLPKTPKIQENTNIPYFPAQKINQNPFFQSIDPPVLKPRDMIPEEEIMNKQVLDSTSSLSGIRNINLEPEPIKPEKKERNFFNPTS